MYKNVSASRGIVSTNGGVVNWTFIFSKKPWKNGGRGRQLNIFL